MDLEKKLEVELQELLRIMSHDENLLALSQRRRPSSRQADNGGHFGEKGGGDIC